jgi:HEPN domain-containing protein
MKAYDKAYIEAWLQKAESDLLSAQRLLEIEPMILDNACFHCQQAIEKSLKGYLCYKGEEVIKTHSITFLLSECAVFDPIFDSIDPLNLNAYAVRMRYPDDGVAPEVEEVKELYRLAVYVNTLVKEKILFVE